ncbi:MAG: hypothetical protein Q9170_003361 [Blastenia crenularia]
MPSITACGRRVAFAALLASVTAYFPSLLKYDQHGRANIDLQDHHPIPRTIDKQTSQVIATSEIGQETHNSSTIPLTSTLEKRAEIDVTYTNLVCKAAVLIGRISAAPPIANVYTREDLRYNGWDYRDDGFFSPNDNIIPALRDLEIPHSINDAKYVQLTQSEEFRIRRKGKKRYPPTGGHYDSSYILSDEKSTIIASNNQSPEKAATGNQRIPELFRWSDLVWYTWSKIAGDQAKKLRYIIQESITTTSTRRIMEYVEGIHDKPDTLNLPWPGHALDLRSDRGRALLATPHGVGLAWMIADHSNVLGRKYPVVCYFTAPGLGVLSKSEVEYFMIWQLRDEMRNDFEDPNKNQPHCPTTQLDLVNHLHDGI